MKLNRPGPAVLVAGALLFLGCSTPKYVNYWSQWRDWRSSVPWGWNIATERAGDDYAITNLIGPFAPEFYHGVPSFSVRWYRNKAAHRLPDGMSEAYRDADDFIKQTLAVVYGGNYTLVSAAQDAQKRHPDSEITEVYVSGRKAKHFVVVSSVEVPIDTPYGVLKDRKNGHATLVRMHEYVVVPMSTGFYAIVYPATPSGFDLFSPQFNAFVNKFTIAKEGPAGAALAIPTLGGEPAASAPMATQVKGKK